MTHLYFGKKITAYAGFEPATHWTVASVANHSAKLTLGITVDFSFGVDRISQCYVSF